MLGYPVYKSKMKLRFWRTSFFLANQNSLKAFEIDLIGKKGQPSKEATLVWYM